MTIFLILIFEQKHKNDLTDLRHIFSLKNPVLGKTNCKYFEGLLLHIMLNKSSKNFDRAKSLISHNPLSNIFLDALVNSSF